MIGELALEGFKGAVVGGLIGYVTNRLAVWMLFHPRRQLRPLGVPVPLTPGLVVKNQERLADAIGRAVARDLLDSETLVSHFREIDLAGPINRVLAQERESLSASESSLAELLGPAHRPALERVRETIADDLTRRAAELARRFELGHDPLVRDLVRAAVGETFDQPIGRVLTAERRAALRDWIIGNLTAYIQSDRSDLLLRQALDHAIDNFAGSDAYHSFAEAVRDGIRPHLPGISTGLQEGIARYLETEGFEEFARPKLADRLYDLIVGKYPMAAMLINRNTIGDMLESQWESFVGELQEMVRIDKLTEVLSEKIDGSADQLLGVLAATMTEGENRERVAALVGDELRRAMDRALHGDTGRGVIDDLLTDLAGKSLGDLMHEHEAWIDQIAALGLGRLADWAEGDAGRGWIRERLAELIDRFLFRKPVGDMVRFIPDREWNALSTVLGELFHERAMRIIPVILHEQVDLAGVVSAKIRDFDAMRIEEAIQRVSGRELSGIVRLGGLIGLVVGAAMQIFYWWMG